MANGRFVVSVSEFRRRLAALIDDVGRNHHPLFLTQYGTVAAVLVSREEYASWHPDQPSGRDGHAAPSRRPAPACRGRSAVAVQRGPRLTALPERKDLDPVREVRLRDRRSSSPSRASETELIWTDEGWATDDEG